MLAKLEAIECERHNHVTATNLLGGLQLGCNLSRLVDDFRSFLLGAA